MVLSMDERLLDAAFLKGRSLFCSQTSRCTAASLLPALQVGDAAAAKALKRMV